MVSFRFVLLLSMLLTPLFGASVEWNLSPRVSVNTQIKAELIIKTEGQNVTDIDFPQVDALSWLTHDQVGRSSQFVIRNGQQEHVRTLTWLVIFSVSKEGSVTIPPITVHLSDGSTVNTTPQQLTSLQPRSLGTGNFLAQVLFEPASVVIGEDVTMVYELFIRKNDGYTLSSIGAKAPAEAIVLTEKDPSQSDEVDKDGQTWVVFRKEWSLIFTQAGNFQSSGQQPISVVTGTNIFGQKQTRNLAPIPIKHGTVVVRNLPTEGQPNGFEGLIGPISIEAQLDRDTIVVGQGGMLSLFVRGRNVDLMSRPRLPELPGLRFYDVDESKDQSQALFRWSVEPTETGQHTIPSIRVPYYDPQHKRYHHATHSPLEFSAAPGRKLTAQVAGASAPDNEQVVALAALGTDAPQAIRAENTFKITWAYQLIAGLIALLIGIVSGLSLRAYKNSSSNKGPHRGQNLARALRTDDLAQINQALHTIQSAITHTDDQERCRALIAAVEQARFGGNQLSSKQRREAYRLTRYP